MPSHTTSERIKNALSGAGETTRNIGGTIRSRSKTRRNKRLLSKTLRSRLPSTLLGRKNFNKASRRIRMLARGDNPSAARQFTISQLRTILGQVRGTGSEGEIAKRLRAIGN